MQVFQVLLQVNPSFSSQYSRKLDHRWRRTDIYVEINTMDVRWASTTWSSRYPSFSTTEFVCGPKCYPRCSSVWTICWKQSKNWTLFDSLPVRCSLFTTESILVDTVIIVIFLQTPPPQLYHGTTTSRNSNWTLWISSTSKWSISLIRPTRIWGSIAQSILDRTMVSFSVLKIW